MCLFPSKFQIIHWLGPPRQIEIPQDWRLACEGQPLRTSTSRCINVLMAKILLTSWGWQFIPFFTRFYTSRVVQDFFHQQYYGFVRAPTCRYVRIPIFKISEFITHIFFVGLDIAKKGVLFSMELIEKKTIPSNHKFPDHFGCFFSDSEKNMLMNSVSL